MKNQKSQKNLKFNYKEEQEKEMSEVSANQREYRKAFGQLASTKTQRIDTLKPLEIEK